MSELNDKLLEIKRQKDEYILPENLKKNVTVYGVTGTLEPGSGGGDVKLFDTVEHMQQDPDASAGDLALVYDNNPGELEPFIRFNTMICPDEVTLSEAVTDYISFNFVTDESSTGYFDGSGDLRPNGLSLWGWSSSGELNIEYSSSDGVTYTRTDGGSSLIDIQAVAYLYIDTEYETFDSRIGKFFYIVKNTFNGLYKYDGETYVYAPTQLSNITPDYVLPDKTVYANNGIVSGSEQAYSHTPQTYIRDNYFKTPKYYNTWGYYIPNSNLQITNSVGNNGNLVKANTIQYWKQCDITSSPYSNLVVGDISGHNKKNYINLASSTDGTKLLKVGCSTAFGLTDDFITINKVTLNIVSNDGSTLKTITGRFYIPVIGSNVFYVIDYDSSKNINFIKYDLDEDISTPSIVNTIPFSSTYTDRNFMVRGSNNIVVIGLYDYVNTTVKYDAYVFDIHTNSSDTYNESLVKIYTRNTTATDSYSRNITCYIKLSTDKNKYGIDITTGSINDDTHLTILMYYQSKATNTYKQLYSVTGHYWVGYSNIIYIDSNYLYFRVYEWGNTSQTTYKIIKSNYNTGTNTDITSNFSATDYNGDTIEIKDFNPLLLSQTRILYASKNNFIYNLAVQVTSNGLSVTAGDKKALTYGVVHTDKATLPTNYAFYLLDFGTDTVNNYSFFQYYDDIGKIKVLQFSEITDSGTADEYDCFTIKWYNDSYNSTNIYVGDCGILSKLN